MIIIKKCYSWYNVYADNVLILKHINENDKTDILEAARISGENITEGGKK